MDYDLNAPSAGGEFIVSIIGSNARGWRSEDIAVYEDIKCRSDKVVYVSREYTQDCMHRRNRHLVDHSGTCICYLTRTYGGTAYTVDYARRKGLRIINVANDF